MPRARSARPARIRLAEDFPAKASARKTARASAAKALHVIEISSSVDGTSLKPANRSDISTPAAVDGRPWARSRINSAAEIRALSLGDSRMTPMRLVGP